MSSMVKKFLNNKGKKPQSGGSKRDLKTVTCYNCQGKGHFAKDCKKEKVERPPKDDKQEAKIAKEEKRAFFTAWGDSDTDSEESEPDCLMANADASSDDEDDCEVKVTDLKPELIEHDDLVSLANCLIEENSTCNEHLENLEAETKELKTEIHFLKRSLADAEQMVKVAKNEAVEYVKHAKINSSSCLNCKGKTRADDSVVNSKLDNSLLDVIVNKLDYISSTIDARTVPQIVFVRARPGLGFNEDDTESNESSESQNKLVKELTEKIHTRLSMSSEKKLRRQMVALRSQ